MNDYEKLQEQVKGHKERRAKEQKEGYAYARSLGFTGAESLYLKGKTKEFIDHIASLRDKS